MPKLLIVSGGWEGHKPHEVATIVGDQLTAAGFDVTKSDNLDSMFQAKDFDVVMPNWTMGEISHEQGMALLQAVESGVGLAGLHGGMGDSFRGNTDYQFMVGGQFVSHPQGDGRKYSVQFKKGESLTEGLEDFEVSTEKYYMHVDPANHVLATTVFEDYDNAVMPVVWTKTWGKGKVFYCSLGHAPEIVSMPVVLELFKRGVNWVSLT